VATIDLRQPDLRREIGLITDTVSERFQYGDDPGSYRDRADTEALIVDALVDGPMTRLQVARALGRAKSPWTREILESLVSRGLVVRQHGRWRGVLMYVYSLPYPTEP
jgi:hypothetical protein